MAQKSRVVRSSQKKKTSLKSRKSMAREQKMTLTPRQQRGPSPSQSAAVEAISSLPLLLTMFGVFFVAQSVLLAVIAWIFPDAVVLGTHQISPLMAIIYSMAVFTLFVVGTTPLIELAAANARIKLSDWHWMALFLAVDSIGIWGVARFAETFGLGISSWLVAVVLGLIFNIVQGLLIKNVINPQS